MCVGGREVEDKQYHPHPRVEYQSVSCASVWPGRTNTLVGGPWWVVEEKRARPTLFFYVGTRRKGRRRRRRRRRGGPPETRREEVIEIESTYLPAL